MVLFRYAPALLLAVGFAVAANAQAEKTFPTDDEINLMLTQTERAMQQYEPLIDQEETAMGKGGTDAVANDRQVVNSLELAVRAFRSKPQGLNGPLGFAFFEWLDDASRNAALCASYASSQIALKVMDGDTSKAESLLQLAHSCNDASTLIYTVSENAGTLYQRYVEAEQQLANQGADAAEKCVNILKNNCSVPKK
jgi:hypothetical protein